MPGGKVAPISLNPMCLFQLSVSRSVYYSLCIAFICRTLTEMIIIMQHTL